MSTRHSWSTSTPWPFSTSLFPNPTAARVFRTLTLTAALLVLRAPLAQAGKPVRGPCPAGTVDLGIKCGTAVITEIKSFDSDGDSYTIAGDGVATVYGVDTYTHGDGVLSYLLEDGNNGKKHDWFLDVRGSTRLITENIVTADRIEETTSPYYEPWGNSPPGLTMSQGHLNVQCTFVVVDLMELRPASEPGGGPVTCPFINAFLYNGDDYWALNAHKSFYQSPQNITDVQITCNSFNTFDTRGCDDWSITPITDPTLQGYDAGLLDPFLGMQAIGRLVHNIPADKKQRGTKEDDGNFKMRFYIHLWRPNPAP